MKNIILVLALLTLVGCVDSNYSYPGGGYGGGYPSSGGYNNNRDCSYYGNCPYGNNNPYGGGYNNNRCGGNKRCGNDRCGGNKKCGGDRDTVINVPPPPPVQKIEIQPSCPSGSVLDGRGCRVTDPSKRRAGGDGYMNPCPGGYYSGGRCVSN